MNGDLKCAYLNFRYNEHIPVYCTNEEFLETIKRALACYAELERAEMGLGSCLNTIKEELNRINDEAKQ